MSTQVSAQTNKAVITLENGAAYVEIVNGAVRNKKPITIESLSQIIEQQTAMRTPLLPGDWGTRLFARKGNKEYYMITTPPGRQEIKYEHRGRYDGDADDYNFTFTNGGSIAQMEIPRPALAWFVVAEITSNDTRKIRGDVYVHAIKHQVLGLNDALFRAPFTNVYGRGNICWSGNLNSVMPTPAALISLQSQFFAAAFNNDLDDGRFRRFASPHGSIRENQRIQHMDQMFHHLHTELLANPDARFPEAQLVPVDKTVGSFFNRFVEEN